MYIDSVDDVMALLVKRQISYTRRLLEKIANKVGLLDKTLNTSLMAFLIHNFFSILSYIRQNRFTLSVVRYQISRRLTFTSFLDACLHTTAQKRMVKVVPCTFSKSYYELILIYNIEQKYFTTCSAGAKLFVHSIDWRCADLNSDATTLL